MLAARWWGRHDVRVEEVTDPGRPGAGEVRLRVAACGLCGTDVEEYTAGPVIVPTSPHPLSGASAPLILGHETVGIVDEAGPDVDLAPGAFVAVEANLYCGRCWWCRRRQFQLCERLASLGLMADGGLAEYLIAPAGMCAPFTNGVSPDQASLAEPLAVAVRAVRRAGVGIGSTLAVVGAGTVGLLCLQVARRAGARVVVSIDPLEERRQLAKQLGADVAVAPSEAEEASRDLTTIGPDAVIEAAGNPDAAASAVRLVRRGGTAVLLGVFDSSVPVDMMDLLLGEKTVAASLSHVYDDDFTAAVALIDQGAVEVDALITDRIALADVVERGFNALVSEPEVHLKIVVLPES